MLPQQLNISSNALGRVLSQLAWLPMGKVEKACRLPIWRHQQCGRYVYCVNNQYIESPEKKRRSSGGATQCACSSFTQHDKNCNLGEWSPPCDAHHFPEYGVPRVSPSAAAPPAAAATRGGAMEVSTAPAFAREDAMGGAHDAILASGDAPHFAAEPTSHSAFGDLSAYRVIRDFEVQLRLIPRIPGFVFRQIVTAMSPLAQQYGYGRNRKITSARALSRHNSEPALVALLINSYNRWIEAFDAKFPKPELVNQLLDQMAQHDCGG